jgi:glutamate dehydrogenase
LLVEMTDDVAHLVLEDNRLQTLALSFMENDGAVALPSYVRVIEILESTGRLDRAVEGLSSNEELLRRAQEGRGLTRPELSVLLASTKLALQDAIEHGRLGHDPELESDLRAAFPPRCSSASPPRSTSIACAARSSRPSSPIAWSTASACSIRSSLPRRKAPR